MRNCIGNFILSCFIIVNPQLSVADEGSVTVILESETRIAQLQSTDLQTSSTFSRELSAMYRLQERLKASGAPADLFDTSKLKQFDPSTREFPVNQLGEAFDAALRTYVKRGQLDSSIRFIGPSERRQAATPEALKPYLEAYGIDPRWAKYVTVYPLKLGVDPVIEFPFDPTKPLKFEEPDFAPLPEVGPAAENDRQPAPTDNKVVGPDANPVDNPIPGSRPALHGTAEQMMLVALGRPSDTTPILQAGRVNPAGTDGAGPFCGEQDASPCFHPAVGLHWRGALLCSGVLVGRRWVLTAAHCFCGVKPTRATIGGNEIPSKRRPNPPGSRTVSLSGETRFFSRDFCSNYIVWKSVGEMDPNWGRITREIFANSDLALVRLTSGIDVISSAGRKFRARIGHSSQLNGLSIFYVAGYGAYDADGFGGEKSYAELPVTSANCTGDAAPESCAPERELASIDLQGRTDSCHGDSGAGAYVRMPDASLSVIGVVSRGIEGDCGSGGIYVLVTTPDVRRWIRDVVDDALFNTAGQPVESRFSPKSRN